MFVSNKLGRIFAAMCALLLSMGTMWAQNITVTGRVTDSNGEPVIGAYVLVEGTRQGTSTDFDGVYSLPAPRSGALVFSCMGYRDITVPVNGRSTINVVLEEDAMLLEDAVVVGFGTQRRENLTGAVASVNVSQALESRPIADVGRGLQGMTPGLTIRVGSTEVGSDPLFRIRGHVGSYLGGSSPLILLDNVEIPSINLVNPDDIESISVLKDAASASIYGAKAAFGVILITSKKGAKTETIKVNYSANFSFQSLTDTDGIADVDALHYTVEAAERLGTMTPVGAFWLIDRAGYNAAVAWKEKYGDTLDPYAPMVYGRDWYLDSSNRKIGVRTYDPYVYMINQGAPTQTHNLSVQGKTGKTNFNISLGYLGQSGMLKPTEYDDFTRYNANVRLSTQINDFINVHAGMMYTNSNKSWAFSTNSTTADPWYYLFRWGPTYPLVPTDEFGNSLRNQVYEMGAANEANIKKNYTSVNVGATITPVKNWDINFDYTYAVNNSQEFNPGITYWAADLWAGAQAVKDDQGNFVTVKNEWDQFNKLGPSIIQQTLPVQSYTQSYDSYYQDSYTSIRQTWNITTDYSLKLANHKFDFLLGMQAVDYRYTGVWGKKMTLMDITNPQFALATGTQTSGGTNSWNSTLGFFGRVNYNYKERYLFEANLRYDGSSKFPTHLKWRWFPSFSAGWRLTQEPWMQDITHVLSSMKLRASWGMIGDQTVSSSQYIPLIGAQTTYWMHSGIRDNAYATPAIVASDITWQDIVTLDLGLEFSLFNQVDFVLGWYQRDTKNMIVGMEGLGYNLGSPPPNGNYGSLRTRGWEASVTYRKIFDNGFSFSASASVSDAKTIITEYGSALSIGGWYNGKTYGEIWGYRVDDLYTWDDFGLQPGQWAQLEQLIATDKYGRYYQNAKGYASQGKITSGSAISGPGDVRFKDLNGDGIIDNGSQLLTVKDENGNDVPGYGDLDVIGNTTPRYEYSFRVDLGWKGFDFSMFWQGIGQRDLWGGSPLTIPGFNSSDGAMAQAIAGNFWYETLDASGNVIDARYDAFYPRANNLYSSGTGFNMQVCDRYLLNMAYLRLKNVTLGYTIPEKITKKAFIDKLRVYISLENFLTFDNLRGLPIDVEEIPGYSYLNSSNYNSSRTGVGAPAFKSASFGVQLTF